MCNITTELAFGPDCWLSGYGVHATKEHSIWRGDIQLSRKASTDPEGGEEGTKGGVARKRKKEGGKERRREGKKEGRIQGRMKGIT